MSEIDAFGDALVDLLHQHTTISTKISVLV
jgi:hypothetical protein